MKKKKEFKVTNTVKNEDEPFKLSDIDEFFEKEYAKKLIREKIMNVIAFIVLPILLVVSWATLLITDAVKESKMRKDCVTYLAQTYNISDDYMYDVEEVNNIKTSNKNIEYLCKVIIYNDDWHIEAIMSVSENNEQKNNVNIEKILKEVKGDINN